MVDHAFQSSSSRPSGPYPHSDSFPGLQSYSEGIDHGTFNTRPDERSPLGSVGNQYFVGDPIYEHKLINANPNRPLYETRVIDLHQDMLDLLEHHKMEVFASIASLAHAVLRQTNHYRFSGEGIPFEIIPFANGSMPNELPHLLPALTSVHVVKALTPEQLVRYCSGYRIPHDPTNTELMRVDLKAHIGWKS